MKETALRIRIFGDPVLRKKTKSVAAVTQAHRDLLSQMARLMYDAQGIGLAAPQVGSSESLIVVDIGAGLYKLINPRIVNKRGIQKMEEGCLSIPGICINVARAKEVTVDALSEQGKQVIVKAEGLLACVLQHEIEHLSGKLIVDHASFLEKVKITRKLKQLQKKAAHGTLPESETQSCKLQL